MRAQPADLLAALAEYRVHDPAEASMLARMWDFVERHPDCFSRSCAGGHVTASAWILNEALSSVVLLHHAKLLRWLQPGGHIEPGDASTATAARREAGEETGLLTLTPIGGVFDIDVHAIPARPGEPGHLHYDVRYAFTAPRDAQLTSLRGLRSAGVNWHG